MCLLDTVLCFFHSNRWHTDFIVLNSLQESGAGFKHDTNKISIIDENNIRKFELKSKENVAQDILEATIEKLNV